MRLITLIVCLLFSLENQAQNDYITKIKLHRDSINASFKDSSTSILDKKYQNQFTELAFYPVNEKFRVKAKFKAIKKAKVFEMKTTTKRLPLYKAYGKLYFEIAGKALELTVYQSQDLKNKDGYEDYLFIPFTDLTSGEESYGGGRYLDLRIKDLEDPIIDFNLCYNPYCNYNSKYSCPIPPAENFLDVKIEAGVKAFLDSKY